MSPVLNLEQSSIIIQALNAGIILAFCEYSTDIKDILLATKGKGPTHKSSKQRKRRGKGKAKKNHVVNSIVLVKVESSRNVGLQFVELRLLTSYMQNVMRGF